jgi:pleckstrin family protein A (phosphoinositide binding specific) protein 8
MMESEIAKKTTTASGSATDALLWLKRALMFIRVFLGQVLEGQPSLSTCASTAYEQTLRKYHNFLVKGIFSVWLLKISR